MILARAGAPLAHGVSYIARHLGDLNRRLGGIDGRWNDAAGKRQRRDESSHRVTDCVGGVGSRAGRAGVSEKSATAAYSRALNRIGVLTERNDPYAPMVRPA